MSGQGMYSNALPDFEVNDNLVIGSPGGLSAIHHHPQGDMYGTSFVSNDINGAGNPRYPYGVYGNLYSNGHDAGTGMGYYPMHQQSNYPNNNFPNNTQQTVHPEYWTNMTPERENFELLDEDGNVLIEEELIEIPHHKQKINPYVLFLLVFVLFISFEFWATGIHKFIVKYIHGDCNIGWEMMILYAILFSLLFFFIVWISGTPFRAISLKL